VEMSGKLTSEVALQQAQTEELTLLRSDNNKTRYLGVYYLGPPGRSKPYQARLSLGGKFVHLGYFSTAEEAALCVARSPEQRVAAKRAAAAPALVSDKEAPQQAQAKGLVLRLSKSNQTGYVGVRINQRSRSKPYQANVWRGGKSVNLGAFANAEEAALCVARSPEGGRAAAALTSEEARQQAQAEGLALRVSKNKTGYFRVRLNLYRKTNPFQAQVWRGRKKVHLGSFATAEEAALCVARSPEAQAAVVRAAAAPAPLTSEEARQQAQAEGLALRVSKNKTGAFSVKLNLSCKTKPFQAQATRGRKKVHLGGFATAEETALCVARSPAPPFVSKVVNAEQVASDYSGDDAGEEGEEEFEVLDAVEVLDAWSDDDNAMVSS